MSSKFESFFALKAMFDRLATSQNIAWRTKTSETSWQANTSQFSCAMFWRNLKKILDQTKICVTRNGLQRSQTVKHFTWLKIFKFLQTNLDPFGQGISSNLQSQNSVLMFLWARQNDRVLFYKQLKFLCQAMFKRSAMSKTLLDKQK